MGKTLIGIKKITEYLEVSKAIFYQLVSEGMPAAKGAGGWRTHTDLLDEYFKESVIENLPPKKSKA